MTENLSGFCEEHGLRYDPAATSGCVLCRRKNESRGGWKIIGAIAAVIVIAIGVKAVVSSSRDSPESAPANRQPEPQSRTATEHGAGALQRTPPASHRRVSPTNERPAPPQPRPEPKETPRVALAPRPAQTEPAFVPAAPVSVPCGGGKLRCVVPVSINGTQLDLIVDTGAQITVLWQDAASRAGLSPGSDAPVIPVRGVTGGGVARLVHGTVGVGGFEESGIIMAVMPGSGPGADGLLGMSYLGRFRTGIAGQLRLQPLDAADPNKIGGHGRAYWAHRFRDVARARSTLKGKLQSARDLDRKIEEQIGIAPGEATMEDRLETLEAFVKELDDELWIEAGRCGVPKEWRR